MALLVMQGAEWGDTSTNSAATGHPDFLGGSVPAARVTNDSATVASGLRSWKITADGASTVPLQPTNLTNSTLGRVWYTQAKMRFSALPASGKYVSIVQAFAFGTTSTRPQILLRSDGTLELYANNTLIGSASSAISTNTFVTIELAWSLGTGAIDYAEARLDRVSFASTSTGSWSDTAAGNVQIGILSSGVTPSNGDASGVFANGDIVYVDDIQINDSTGTANNSWPGGTKVLLLLPISLNANGGSYTDDAAATTSAALTNAIDNAPPKGIADTTAGGGDHQVRNAAANTTLDMNMKAYSTAGINTGDTVNGVLPMCNVGAPASTGAKSGSFGVTSNPVIAQRIFTGGSGTAAFFWRGAAAGTYPTGWGWEIGTMTEAPSVTVGTSPVARLSITAGTTTRIAMCDALGIYVSYTPAASATPPKPTVIMQAINRAASW